jgi:hypothetical protein
VSGVPSYDELAAVDREVLWGLIGALGEPTRVATYEHSWQRDPATWQAVGSALAAAAAGESAGRTTAPRWLDPLVRRRLKAMASGPTWHAGMQLVRLLERTGLVSLAADDDYVLAVVGSLGLSGRGGRAAALRDDVELRERVVWRMFEVEGGGQVSLTNVDKFIGAETSWGDTFQALVADGTLPRDRVLRECLTALGRDFSAYRASWYSTLYTALEPAPDEVAADQSLVRDLLRSDVAPTVSFAVKLLRSLARAGLLDRSDTVDALRPAVLCRVKGTAVEAVRLLDALSEDCEVVGVVGVATTALEHPHADVQRAAASLLERLGAGGRVVAAGATLQPSVRRTPTVTVQDVQDVDAVPREQTLAAAAGPGDVVDRLAALLEDASSAVEVELVLAGLAALDDRDRLRPLVKRATAVLARGRREGVTPGWLRGQLARVVLTGTGQAVPPLPAVTTPVDFLVRRIDDAMARTGALVATPERQAGWITPSALVERLQRATVTPSLHDLAAALLRLGWPGRTEALAAMTERGALVDEVAAVVRYALGAAPQVPVVTPALWVAASRARAPVSVDTWLADQGLVGAGRSHPLDARPVFAERTYSWQDRSGLHSSTYATWSIELTDVRPGGPEEPTACGRTSVTAGRWDLEDYVGWGATTWPHDAEHFMLDGCDPVFDVAGSTEVRHDAIRVLAALGRHQGRLGPLTTTTLAAGLSAGKADQRVFAVDAAIQLSAIGTLTAELLAGGLVAALPLATLPRWATSLGEVASSGPRGRALVIDALGSALPSVPRESRGLHSLLELLTEELLRAGRPASPTLRPWLEGFAGGSRVARAARTLVAR